MNTPISQIKKYIEALSELGDIADDERMHSCLEDDDNQYVDGFLAGYHQALKDATDTFHKIW